MTKEELKYLLDSYKFENQLLNEKVAELNKINEQHFKKFERLKPISDDNQQMINEAIMKYKEETSLLENQIELIKNKKERIETKISNVSQPGGLVLYYRYIQCLSVSQIATKMNYSTQRIYQLHTQGIAELLEKEDA